MQSKGLSRVFSNTTVQCSYLSKGRKQRGTKESLDNGGRGEREICLKTHHSKNSDHDIQSLHFMANRWRNNGNSGSLYFSWALKSLHMVTASIKLRHLLLGRKVMTNLGSVLKSREITLPTMVCIDKARFFQWSCMDVRVGP